MKYVVVRWCTGPIRGYEDWFPASEFAREVDGAEAVHSVLHKKSGVYHARYQRRVHGERAELDYRPFPDFNGAQGMLLGVMSIVFKDRSRLALDHVEWNGKTLEPSQVELRVHDGPLPDSIRVAESGPFESSQSRSRPGQPAFRRAVMDTYGDKCCVSRCPIPSVLQAAHIVSVEDGGADTPSNGLLLRSDIHALLDSHECAIHPETRAVHFSNEARIWSEYAELHGETLVPPQDAYRENAPERSALERRWKTFLERQGEVAELGV